MTSDAFLMASILSFTKGETALSSPVVHLCVNHKVPKNRCKITELLARHNQQNFSTVLDLENFVKLFIWV